MPCNGAGTAAGAEKPGSAFEGPMVLLPSEGGKNL